MSTEALNSLKYTVNIPGKQVPATWKWVVTIIQNILEKNLRGYWMQSFYLSQQT